MPSDAPLPPALLSLMDASSDATFVLDGAGNFLYANAAAAAMVRLQPEQLLGRSLEGEFSAAFSARWLAARAEVRRERRPVTYDAFNPAIGGWVRVHVVPHGEALAVQIRDVTTGQQTAALQRVSVALADASTPEQVMDVLLNHAVAAAGAYMASLTGPTADGQALELRGTIGFSEALKAQYARFPITLDLPTCHAARTHEPVFVGGRAFDEQFPESLTTRAEATRSIAALPMVVDGALWGVLTLSFREVRTFSEEERRFLMTLVQQCAQALGRVTAEVRLQEQAETLETLNRIGQALSAELDLSKLVQAVTDAGVELTGAQFGAFFYNLVNEQQESYTLYTLSGVPREAFSSFPMPRNTQVFAPTFHGEGVVRSPDITRDARYGHTAPHHGMPPGHLPVRSYLAVPVTARSGEVLGGLFFGHADVGVFTARAEALTVGLAAQTAVALDNARLYQQLQFSHATLERRVLERTRELEEQRVALDAFVAFSERTASSTDVQDLARHATNVLRTTLGNVSAAYYERDGELWKARVMTDDIQPDMQALARAGFPVDLPSFAMAVEARDALFVDGWDPAAEGVAAAAPYGAAASQPYFVRGEATALFTMASTSVRAWTARERAVFQAVARSLGLALERAEQTTRLAVQNAELGARAQALEAFANLTRDLAVEADVDGLVRRAQEILLSLLPEGYALYWQQDGDRWRSRSQVGSLGHPGLQAAVDDGFPLGHAPTLDVPWTTREPLYEDEYARGADTDPDVVQHVSAAAMLPVMVGDTLHGLIGVGLFQHRQWTAMDRAVLETVAHSLGLALEAALSAAALRERTLELERSNAELEKFAYVASHDLQEPLRTIASFAGLIERKYAGVLDEQGLRYLAFVTRGAQRMKVLIDDLLVFSRLNAVQDPLEPLDVTVPVREALDRLHDAVERTGARVTVEALPAVMGAPSELVQLFQNLIGNALKFRREGVTPEVHVRAEPDGAAWHFRVVDNGIGFGQEYAERVFQIFQRLHVREQYEGTGMGLAICRKIVERHGGRIWAESQPGVGSTFHFTLQGVPAPGHSD
ncbi:GAF domain-containing sensor histidine kinase [Deinococcus maricopensis]|nr:GAF domain-containing protein [Deinococcus maricopensis]